jgi:undecaprenyl-diphosphatase
VPARQPAMVDGSTAVRVDPSRVVAARRTEGGSTSVLQAIVLGITQGLTEFAPVSSSGHLILVPWLFGWTIVNNEALNKTFDVALHMGTLIGALIYFRSDVALYLTAWVRSIRQRAVRTADERLAWLLVLATIPGAIAGALFESVIEDKLGQPWLIAVFLAVGGIVLYFVDTRCRSDRVLADLRTKDAAIIGIAQAVALQPGVSRSGITITAARALGVERASAARFSFLLSLPIIAGAGLFKAVGLVGTGFQGYGSQFFWGFVASAISGYLVIAFLLSYLRRHDFTVFVIYRLAVAALVFLVIITGFRSATI